MDELRRAKVPYTQVANVVLYDGRLSFKAKGLYAYLYAKPNGWHFSAKRIAEEASDGRKAVLSALQELEAHGYLERKKQADGRVVYHLSHTIAKVPKGDLGTQDPKSPNGTVPKGHRAQTAPVIKKEIDKERDRKKKYSSGAEAPEESFSFSQELELLRQGGTDRQAEGLQSYSPLLEDKGLDVREPPAVRRCPSP